MLSLYLRFIIFAVVIVYFGYKLSHYGQIIAEKRFISKALFGVILLAFITSLPELIVNISSVTLVDAPDMAFSDVMGSVLFNLLILALLDLIQGKGGILSISAKSHALTVSLTIVMLGLIALTIIQRTITNIQPGFGHIGYESIIFILIYILSTRMIYKHSVEIVDLEGKQLEKVAHFWGKFIISGLIVVICGLFLAKIGKEIVINSGMSETFVGLVFLAVVTSLPELIVSVSALKLGSVDMAVGNILGSNLFDTLIIPVTDLFYLKAQILSAISLSHVFTISLAIVFSAIVMAGLLYRSKKSFLKFGWDIIAMLIIFALSIFFFYYIK
jgi:cation:H+ antiporter